MKYRIKTLEEFQEEYGKNWRNCIKCGWSEYMDEYLGKEISEDIWNKINMLGTAYISELGSWTFSKEMLIKEEDTPVVEVITESIISIKEPISKSKTIKFPF